MKALKSKLASELLSDSTARGQLREFLMNKRASSEVERQVAAGRFVIVRGSSAGAVLATVVPKAAKAA
jgi:hypothetical protein